MLRVDNNAKLVRLGWSFPRVFSGRFAIESGKRVFATRWKRVEIDRVLTTQKDQPVALCGINNKMLWYFHDRFYWDDDGLTDDDVNALVLQRERRLQQKLQSARSLMHAEEAGRPMRTPISSDLRRAVFERDGGRCVQCGSSFDIQYDHILPVTLGGATTIENLQVLCAECNRRKSDSL